MLQRLDRKDDTTFKGVRGHAVPFDAKLLTETGEFEGYASTFGNEDLGADVVVAGAFSETLIKRPADKVKGLFQHRSDTIICKWTELREDSKGLYAKGKLFLAIQKAREVYELMKEGALDSMSIGFRTLVEEWDRQLAVRRLLKVDLREISVVTFPMNEQATVSLVKGDKMPTEREFEQFLVRDAGFSAQQAKTIISSGFKSLKATRDAGGGDDRGELAALRAAMQGLSSSLRG
jgi:hypothetical protein